MSFLDELFAGLSQPQDVAAQIGADVVDRGFNLFGEESPSTNGISQEVRGGLREAANYLDPLYFLDRLNTGDGFGANFSRGVDKLTDPVVEGARSRYPNLFGNSAQPQGQPQQSQPQAPASPAQVIEQKKQEVAAESKQRTMTLDALMQMLAGGGGVVDGNTVLDPMVGSGRGPGGGSFSKSSKPIAEYAPVSREDVRMDREGLILDALRRRAIGSDREGRALYGKGMDNYAEQAKQAMGATAARDSARMEASADQERSKLASAKQSRDELDSLWTTANELYRKRERYYRENPDALAAPKKKKIDGKEVSLTNEEQKRESEKYIRQKALEDAIRALPPRYQDSIGQMLLNQYVGE